MRLLAFLINSWFFFKIRKSVAKRTLGLIFWISRIMCCTVVWFLRNFWFPCLELFRVRVFFRHRVPPCASFHLSSFNFRQWHLGSDEANYWFWTIAQRWWYPFYWTNPSIWSIYFQILSSFSSNCPDHTNTFP